MKNQDRRETTEQVSTVDMPRSTSTTYFTPPESLSPPQFEEVSTVDIPRSTPTTYSTPPESLSPPQFEEENFELYQPPVSSFTSEINEMPEESPIDQEFAHVRDLTRPHSDPSTYGGHLFELLRQETVVNTTHRTNKSYHPCLCLLLCFLGGFSIGYLNALPGQVVGSDGFLIRVARHLWNRRQHADVNNYCDFFDARLQLVLSSQHLTQLAAVLITPFLFSRFRTMLTLHGALMLVMIGIGLLIWLPSTMVAIIAFLILNFGIGLASRVFPLLLSRHSLQKYSILYDLGSWIGGSLPVLVVYLTIDKQTWAWRVAFGSIGVLICVIFVLSLFLPKTPQSTSKSKPVSLSAFLKRSSIPSIIITTFSGMTTVFSVVGVIQFYGPLLFISANLFSSLPYMPTLLISVIQVISRLISLVIVRMFRARKEFIVVAALTKIIAEALMTGIFVETSTRFTFFKHPMNILIPGCIYVAADACLTASFGWLETPFSEESKVIGDVLSAVVGLLQNTLMSFISTLVLCHFGGKVFYIYLVFDFIVVCFILELVPETTKTNINEVWSSHRVWRRFVKSATVVV
ncbi:sugar transport protein 8-like [Silene latifolia]|uniref:sugar transport protein 8-like n=1 Tax=Silene latifolia TaxID=37657 RepID=UPI003D776C44